MTVVCVGWLRTHPVPIQLAGSDGIPDGQVSYGMCRTCQREWNLAMAELVTAIARAAETMRNGAA